MGKSLACGRETYSALRVGIEQEEWAVRAAIAGTVRAIAGGTFRFAALMAWYSMGDPVSIDNVARAHWRKALLPSRR
jgi:hypothetical protein